jgi:hypothetical protein
LSALRALGFTEDEGKLRYKLDHMDLLASQVWNEWLAPVVSLSGVYQTSRTTGMVACDLLPNESREQGLAFLAYYLGEYARHVTNAPPWLHLFAGSDGGGEHWAVIASLIETCKLCSVEPQTYLADVITKIVNGHLNTRIDDLLPWAYHVTPALKNVA